MLSRWRRRREVRRRERHVADRLAAWGFQDAESYERWLARAAAEFEEEMGLDAIAELRERRRAEREAGRGYL
jgi:hypothetical protein